MILSINNPVYNTIIIFIILMLLIYTVKPNIVYDNKKQQFRQFGMSDGKTLLPIYIIGILFAILLYFFFHYISITKIDNKIDKTNIIDSQILTDTQKYYLQNLHLQMQIQNMQQQIQQNRFNTNYTMLNSLPNNLSIV